MIQTSGKIDPEKIARHDAEAAAITILEKHKGKKIKQMTTLELSNMLTVICIRSGIADVNGIIK